MQEMCYIVPGLPRCSFSLSRLVLVLAVLEEKDRTQSMLRTPAVGLPNVSHA